MIYVATVHWLDDKWIDIQKYYLNKNINNDFRVFSFLNDLPNNHSDKYYYSNSEYIKDHAVKLNILSDMIILDSESDKDWIIFLDGDAFPIADLVEYGTDKLKAYPLVAVRRDEENGEKQPHPCFCLTTVGFWKKIKGDWKMGYEWLNSQGEKLTDVGGNLLEILINANIDWYPLLRSNKKNLHPVSFGLYDDVVYHHGAAFRTPNFRVLHKNLNPAHVLIQNLYRKVIPASLRMIVPPKYRARYRAVAKFSYNVQELGEQIYSEIIDNKEFYLNLMGSDDEIIEKT